MRTDWSHIRTDCKCPVYGLQMSHFSFTVSEHRKSLCLGASRITFQDSHWHRHHHRPPSLLQLSIQRISRLHTLLLSHGIWYTVFENPLQSTTFFHSVQNTQ